MEWKSEGRMYASIGFDIEKRMNLLQKRAYLRIQADSIQHISNGSSVCITQILAFAQSIAIVLSESLLT